MTRMEFIDILKERNIPYQKAEDTGIWKEGYDGVYVNSRREYEMKKAHPRKHKNLYIPHFRVSGFGDGRYYLKDNGYTCYCDEKHLMNLVEEYS